MKKKFLMMIIIIILFTGCSAYALDIQENNYSNSNGYLVDEEKKQYSKLYQQYLELSEEEKDKIYAIPRKYDVPIDILYEDNQLKPLSIITRFFSFFDSSQNEELPESYILLKDENTNIECQEYGGIDIKIENQGSDGLCWAFVSLTTLETHLALRGQDFDFSERHADYLTSKEFGGTRELTKGGWFSTFKDYALSKNGPVLEEDVPYNKMYEKEEYEYLSSLKPQAYVNETIDFPTISKNADCNYTEEEINLFREKVKEHIMTNGGIYASICSKHIKNYKQKRVLYCTGDWKEGSHAITIIGWNDGFSKENFPEDCRPSSDGAYIALNSWGESWGEKGVFYISYEDPWVEYNMSGVVDVCRTIDFEDENLYKEIKRLFEENIVEYDDAEKKICISIKDIKALDLSNKNITKITGIENFVNLANLDLSGNNIEDISVLCNLEHLNELNLSNSKISEVTQIEELTNLENLNLEGNNIEDISGLGKLSNLKNLNLSSNKITQIKGIHELTNLNTLNLSNNKISEITEVSYLEGLTNLEHLNLDNNCITDISYLSKLTSLCSLKLSYNTQLVSIEPLSQLNKIKGIELYDTNVEDISEIINKDNITQIGLRKKVGLIESEITTLELPKFIYQSLTMQENVAAEAIVYYNTNYSEGNYCVENYENKKSIEIKIDAARQVATVELDKKITDEKGVGIRAIEVHIKEGKTAGAMYQAFYEVKKPILNIELGEYINISEGGKSYIQNILINTTIGQIIENIDTNGLIEIYDGVTNLIDSELKIATGMKVKISLDDKYVEYQAVVKGDTNGDGESDFGDILLINKHRLNKVILKDEYLKAGDVMEDEGVDFKDILKINKFRLGKISNL